MFTNIDDYLTDMQINKTAKASVKFGIEYLDVATGGMQNSDLILLGAESGAGKTEIASIIAQNVSETKRVHFFAIEAEKFEMQKRIMFRLLSQLIKTRYNKYIYYREFYNKEYDVTYSKEIAEIKQKMVRNFDNLNFYYREYGKFDIASLTNEIKLIYKETDFIVIDHLHFIDSDNANENKALKDMCSRLRDVALYINKPVLLVAHLRKPPMKRETIIPDHFDFMGSSDIYKIGTKNIMIAPYREEEQVNSNEYATLFRVTKNRIDNSPRSFVAKLTYDITINDYHKDYELGFVRDSYKKFTPLNNQMKVPFWAKKSEHLVINNERQDVESCYYDKN